MRKILPIFVVLLILFTVPGVGYDYRGDDADLRMYIETLCAEQDLPPELVYAMIERESSWNADALNAAGDCFGLMQISKVNLGWLGEAYGIDNLYDPYQNVLAGISMIGEYAAVWGDYHKALMCYNCGCGGAQKLFDQGIYSSAYSRWIVARMEELIGERAAQTRAIDTLPDPQILPINFEDVSAQAEPCIPTIEAVRTDTAATYSVLPTARQDETVRMGA